MSEERLFAFVAVETGEVMSLPAEQMLHISDMRPLHMVDFEEHPDLLASLYISPVDPNPEHSQRIIDRTRRIEGFSRMITLRHTVSPTFLPPASPAA